MVHTITLFNSKNKFEKIYHCCVYSEKYLMMGRGTVRNMWKFIPKINLRKYTVVVCAVKNP